MGKRKKKFQGCRECGHLARHPFCALCTKKLHWVGGVVTNQENQEDLDRSAPSRRIDHRVTIAYLLPFMVQDGLIPEADLPRVTRQVLGPLAQQVVDTQVYGHEWPKHPYRFKVIQADLSKDSAPFVKIRFGGWSCRSHRGAIPADLPAMVLERDGYECVVCGAKSGLLVTYMVPPEEKGSASLGNMTTFCQDCHRERGTWSYWFFLKHKGIPTNRLVIDFRTGYVRSIVSGGKLTV